MLQGVNLYLIGMMGCGKSTVGRVLAEELKYQFFDSDQLIEQVSKQSVAQIFDEQGEVEFRTLETEVLSKLAPYTRLVISTGGGAVLKPENWSYLHHGVVVWLDVAPELLFQRIKKDPKRPLLQTADPLQTLKNILEQRHCFYSQADVRVEVRTDDPAQKVAQQVLESVRARIEQDAPNRAQFYGR